MSKSASKFQEKFMSIMYRGKEIFKPLNTGMIDDHVGCIREFVANIFFYTKNGTTIIIVEKGIEPIIITGHTGWNDSIEFAFAHCDKVCHDSRKQKPHDPNAPYDGYDETADTKERATKGYLPKASGL